MKHLKKFKTKQEYDDYTSGDISYPNISYIEGTKEVRYNPIPILSTVSAGYWGIIDGDVNGDAIKAIRANSHRYLGKSTGNGIMTLCQLDDSDSTKYADGTPADLSGKEGDVFMKLPRFAYKCSLFNNQSQIRLLYGDAPNSSWKQWDGNVLIGVYEAYVSNSKAFSRSEVISTGSVSQSNFKLYAQSRGQGYQIVDWQMHCVMATLFIAQYGSYDSQEKIGSGTSSFNKECGQTDVLGMRDTRGSSPIVGINDNGADGNSQSINFWGLENWWGNKEEWVGNIRCQGSYNYEDGYDGTTRIVAMPTLNNVWINSPRPVNEYLDIYSGSGLSSSSNSYSADKWMYPSRPSSNIMKRSGYSNAKTGGIFWGDCTALSSSASNTTGSRLAFRGTIIEEKDPEVFKTLIGL